MKTTFLSYASIIIFLSWASQALSLIKPWSPLLTRSHSKLSVSVPVTLEKESVDDSFLNVKNHRTRDTTHNALTIFVIDLSMPGWNTRIEATRGVSAFLLPHEKVSVVTCQQGRADVRLPPTTSSIHFTRSLSKIQRSVMGNLGAGMRLGLDVAHEELSSGAVKEVTIAILADGRAHGLVAGAGSLSDNTTGNKDLISAAEAMKQLKSKFQGRVRAVVIDTATTSSDRQVSEEWTPEGSTLATLCNASYFHDPSLSKGSLLRALEDLKEVPN